MEFVATHRKSKRTPTCGKKSLTCLYNGQARHVSALLSNRRLQSNHYRSQSDGLHERETSHMGGKKGQSINAFGVSQTKETVIQRQEQSDIPTVEKSTPATQVTAPNGGSARINRCYTNPEFPDFRCLVSALKLDIDENLWANAPQFYRVATLFPGDNELMWNTFMRYGLGVNLLQTSFGFLGANETLGTILSYGTGVGLKSYDFFQNGVLELDIPIPIGEDLKLDLQLDLNADPNDLTHVRQVGTGVGLSGHF